MYQFTYGGKKGTAFQLVEAKDLVVIRTKEMAAIQEVRLSGQARELLPSLIPVGAFPEANVTVYKCMASEDHQPTALRNAVRSRPSGMIAKAHPMPAML